jgi:SAM-dependent methyltransferase
MEESLAQSPERRFLSAAFLAQYRALSPLMRRYLHGRVIDLGSGTMPFKGLLGDQVMSYDTLDIAPRSEMTTYVGDIQDMQMIQDASYDSAICLEVLEHVPSPQRAVREVHRILEPGGFVIVSVPHLSRLHDEPHDYYRFTKYGLRHLLETAGFEVLELREKGGLVAFLGHQASTLLLAAVWSVPGLRKLAWLLNKWLVTWPCYELDRLTSGSGIFALGYLGLAQKPSVET